jgi:hypothetical protein
MTKMSHPPVGTSRGDPKKVFSTRASSSAHRLPSPSGQSMLALRVRVCLRVPYQTAKQSDFFTSAS